ncbi:antirestriction protein ArdA [Streptomyces sp. URMC 125]|uniref:antirestriction protein ArdA n=1 Tax=Streptomyces sp. URMC 125 TaxID=3423419 RepID=UPI003F1B5F34
MSKTTPRIYVASLSDYNAGILHGVWIDADQNADSIHEEIEEMLSKSPTALEYGEKAEEFAIHDYEGFGPVEIHEHDSIERVATIADLLTNHEFPAPVVAYYLQNYPDTPLDDLTHEIDTAYLGTYHEHFEAVDAVAEYLTEGEIVKENELPEKYRKHVWLIAKAEAEEELNSGSITPIYEGRGTWHLVDAAA